MPTETVVTVGPSAQDYPSLSAAISGESGSGAIAAVNGDLVAADTRLIIECYPMLDTTPVTITGFATDATRYVTIRTPVAHRHSGVWSEDVYRLIGDSAISLLEMETEDLRLDGLQLRYNGTTSNAACIEWTPSSLARGIHYVENCILVMNNADAGDNNSNAIWVNNEFSMTVRVGNNVIYNLGVSQGSGINMSSATAWAHNNTVHGFVLDGITGSDTRCQNNRCTNNGGDDFGTVHSSSDYNLSSDATAPGANSLINRTPLYTDEDGDDYSLASNDPGIDAGTDLSADGSYPISTDISGTTRSGTWDIGAFEFGGSSGGTTGPVINDIGATIDGGYVDLGDGSAVKRILRFDAADYSVPFWIELDTGEVYPVDALPYQCLSPAATQIRLLSSAP